MKKILTLIFVISTITVALYAKAYTEKGVYLGSECGDLCYMIFKTSKGKLALYGYEEDYKNISRGKKYKITYKKNMKIQVADLGKIKVDGLLGIKPIKSKSKKSSGKYLSAIKKECKMSGAPFCYLSKRYVLFQHECKKGDRISCKHIKDIDESWYKGMIKGDISYLQSIHYISNTAKTGKGK